MLAPRLTTHEYLRMPETLLPQELVYGLVRDAPAPSTGHQYAVGELFIALRRHLTQHDIGRVLMSPVDVVLDRDKNLVLQPDLIVVLNERKHIVADRVWGAPDLAVEVMSPRLRIGTLEERLAWFAEYGVRECWLVRPVIRQIEVISFAAGTTDRRRFDAHEPIVSTVLPLLTHTPESMLNPGW